MLARWVEFARERSEMRGRLKRVLSRMREGRKGRGFDRWAGVVEERKRNRNVLREFVGRWGKRRLSRAFTAWQEKVSGERTSVEEIEREFV